MTTTRHRSLHVALALTLATALGACGDDEGTAAGTTTTAGEASTTTTAGATTPTTAIEATTTTAGSTSTTATEPEPSCDPAGFSTSEVSVGFPSTLSGLHGDDIRVGAHECTERIVVELGGTGDVPGYRVSYQADPVVLAPSGEPTVVAGDANLVVQMGAWMPSPDSGGYSGPTDITPASVEHILQLVQAENFEGMSSWVVGVDEERPFQVSVLEDPVRIVVDVFTG